MASVFLCFLSFSFLIILASSSPSTTISLSLSPISRSNSSLDFSELISHIVKSTVERAHHLKNPRKKASSVLHGTSKTPLYPKSYGGYSISLSFGTPPQKIPLVFDTGSSLLWVPCTSGYNCTNCTFSGVDPTKIPTFKPKLSSTTKIISCRNPKCGWLFGPGPGGPVNCSGPCPSYFIQYGLGSTAGVAISDNLDLPGKVVPNFFVGCSLLSAAQPGGIAGFGRAPTSLPNQLKLKKFSYCLLSHKFDDEPKSSNVVLAGAGKSAGGYRVPGVKYTRFHKNPNMSPYDEYYYVNLRKITVDKKTVKLPYKFLVPDSNGNGGTIVDSGSTFTFMERALYDPMVRKISAHMARYKRAHDVEAQSGLGLCFSVSGGRKNVSLPELVFHFKGGAKMELPVANYFTLINNAVCLSIVTDMSPVGPSGPVGPAIILGNNQQQNFYLEYDLEKQRLGLKKKKCG